LRGVANFKSRGNRLRKQLKRRKRKTSLISGRYVMRSLQWQRSKKRKRNVSVHWNSLTSRGIRQTSRTGLQFKTSSITKQSP